MIKGLLKKSLCLISLLIFVSTVVAQSQTLNWEDVPELQGYTLWFNPQDAECFNSGGVQFGIKNSSGEFISEQEFNSLNITDLYVNNRGTTLDTTTHHTKINDFQFGTYTFVPMTTGTQEITFECVLNRPTQGGGIEPVLVKSTTTLTVELLYQNPDFAALSSISYDGVSLGNVPSLTCGPTGQMVVRVVGGSYPYHITMVNNDTGETFTDSLFTPTQCFYEDELSRKYFKFMDVPAGNWAFYLTDGCGTSVPQVVQHLDQIQPPHLKTNGIYVYASSGNPSDENVIKIDVELDCDFEYYLEEFLPYLHYRIEIPNISYTSPYQSFPTYTGSNRFTIYHTVSKSGVKYCDFNNSNSITFRMQLDGSNPFGCTQHEHYAKFSYNRPNPSKFTSGFDQVIVNQTPGDGCTPTITTYRKEDFFIRYSENRPNYANPGNDHSTYRYHFTYPIVWIYRDRVTSKIIKTDTIADDISMPSILSSGDVTMALNSQLPTPLEVPFTRLIDYELRDANGCQLYSGSKEFDFEIINGGASAPSWDVTKDDKVCRSQVRSIRLFERNSRLSVPNDGLTIELISSPDNNLYNFTATYHESQLSTGWTIHELYDLDNTATIQGGTNGRSLEMRKAGLPSGNYLFAISGGPCGQPETLNVYMKGLVSAELTVAPTYEERQYCNEKYLVLTGGQVDKVTAYRTENNDGSNGPLIYNTEHLTTEFRLVSGPLGGYDPMAKKVYHVGDSIRLSLSSDPDHPYVIQVTTNAKPEDICGEFVFDTSFQYTQPSLSPDVGSGLLCSSGMVPQDGNIYVRAANGLPPYTYRLYPTYPPSGDPIAEVTCYDPDSVAVFHDVPNLLIDTVMSCWVGDICPNNSREFQIRFQSMADLQKVWFDDGLKVIHKCEGAYVHVHTLQAGAAFQYEWYLNDSLIFTTMEPDIFLARGTEMGVYHVKIFQTGCGEVIEDSLTIYPKVAPWVTLDGVSPVCPGEVVPVSVTGHSATASPVYAKIAIEGRNGIEVKEFWLQDNETTTFNVELHSNTKVYPVLVTDTVCDYPLAGDTLNIYIDDHFVNPCEVITHHDTVCYLGDAQLLATVESDLISPSSPLTITWCTDYSLTDTVQQEILTHSGQMSSLMLEMLRKTTYRYVAVQQSGSCATSNLYASDDVHMTNKPDSTALACTSSYYFSDDGGPNGDYSTMEGTGHQTKLFYTTQPGMPVTLHFNTLDLSVTSHLYIFSGSQPIMDSLLYHFENGSNPPDVVMSRGDTMLLYFMPGEEPGAGWEAYVRPSPGIAIGDIYPGKITMLMDTVCQTNWKPYDDPKHFADNDPEMKARLDAAVKQYRNYVFQRYEKDEHQCDSTILLSLVVTPPPYDETSTVILSTDTFFWEGERRDSTKQYIKYHHLAGGDCDSVSILNLIVLDVKVFNDSTCYNDKVKLEIQVNTPDLKYFFPRPAVGDVICSDGSILHPDSFLHVKNEKTPIGVVYYIDPHDPTHMSGKAVALFDACSTDVEWQRTGLSGQVRSYTIIEGANTHMLAMKDMNGYRNTMVIGTNAEKLGGGGFEENAPAAWYCWYYDYTLKGPGTVHTGWYLPAIGELSLLFSNRAVVNGTLKKLYDEGLAEPFQDKNSRYWSDSKYWSSTESTNANSAYSISGKGQLNNRNGKTRNTNNPRYVRAVIEFPLGVNM